MLRYLDATYLSVAVKACRVQFSELLDVMMFSARFRAPPCPRKGLRPPEMIIQLIVVSMNSFLPERADTGRSGRRESATRKGAHCETILTDP